VAALLRRAAAERAAVIPWGAGTKLGLGNVPLAYDVALDLAALDQVLEYEPADLVVTAQAGVPLAALQRRLGEAGQFLALDPPYAERATLGGTLAANASGPSRLLYGTARDLVLGLRVALPNGEVVKSGGKVVKNVVGYDLNKMHIGALGTLGVVVEVTLKVHPLPAAEATVCAAFERLEAAHAIAGQLFRSALFPRTVELVRAPLAGLADSEQWRVLMWASGATATVERQVRDALAWCREGGGLDAQRLDGEAHQTIWRSVREFGRTDDGVLLKLTCLPTDVAPLVQAVEQHARPLPDVVARAGNGIVYVVLPPAAGADTVRRAVAEATGRGGSGVVERAPLELKRQLDVWGPIRGDFPLMQALKAQFDPQAILNPGRFVGGI
jgi:glycolate oxidase FAD binding subunit